MTRVFIGLGSNLGDREANLRSAVDPLGAHGVHVTRVSSLYETAPRDFTDQPWYLNQVVEVETELTPQELLSLLLEIERSLGRVRDPAAVSKGPRIVDLDILLYGDAVIDQPGLHIPHPRIQERRFVLEPLAELEPALRIPGAGLQAPTVHELLAGVSDQEVRKIS